MEMKLDEFQSEFMIKATQQLMFKYLDLQKKGCNQFGFLMDAFNLVPHHTEV